MLSRKDTPCIDEGRTLTLLLESCVENSPRVTTLTPVTLSIPTDVIERAKLSNRLHASLVEERKLALATESSP